MSRKITTRTRALRSQTEYALSDETAHMLMDGSALCVRLKFSGWPPEGMTVEDVLVNLVFGEPRVPETPDELVEGWCGLARMYTGREGITRFNFSCFSVTSSATCRLFSTSRKNLAASRRLLEGSST